jgi:hypothetical protein
VGAVPRRLLGTLALWLVGAALLRTTLLPPERCPDVDAARATAAAAEAAGWIERALRDDGTYVYEVDAEGEPRPGYNVVRHAGVTMSLYQWIAAGDDSLLDEADRALAYMRENLVRRDDWAAFATPGTAPKLGASALLLVSLAHRRLGTGEDTHDELMADVARFLLVQQRDDGGFLELYDLGRDRADPRYTSRYATGEAFWALALMHRLFPDDGWDEPTRKVARYLAVERDEEDDFPFPPWPDQWAAYGLAEMAAWPGGGHGGRVLDQPEAAYARRLAGRFGLLLRTESKRREGGLTELVLYRPARAAGLGTWVEASTSMWRLSRLDDRLAPLHDDITERMTCGAGILADRQTDGGADLVDGAWFTDGVSRMDDQQHALSGLLLTAEALEDDR